MSYPDGDPIHRSRWYTNAEVDAYALVPSASHDSSGAYDVIVAGERVGQIEPGRTRAGSRSGWVALYRRSPIPHTGKGTTARNRQAAVADLLIDLNLRWSNARRRTRRRS